MFRFAYYTLIVLILSNCSYYSFKGSIPAHINNVVIPPIVNKTSEYTVATILNEKFLDLMLLENILDIVSFESADSKLDITIKSVSDKPNIFTPDNSTGYEIVNEWKVMIQIDIIWYDLVYNRDIIIVEDIIDSGQTIKEIFARFNEMNPISIKVITLLHKNISKDIDMVDCLTAFDIENKFVIGYGLDYNNLFRNLKDIYIDNE